MSDKKKVLFIYPPSPVMNREDRCQQPIKDSLISVPFPPMDMMYLAAVAEQIGCIAKIVDYSLIDGPISKFKEDLNIFKPDYIVANISSVYFEKDISILEIAKEVLPDVVNVVKGAHFLTENTDVLYKYKSVDLVIVGEAEATIKDILQGKSCESIPGLCYRDGFVAKFTGVRQFIEDLDSLPFPARHLVDNSRYKRPDNKKPQAVIKVARGCPHNCFFCLATPVSGSEVRMRSVDNIVEEIQECVDKYGIKDFYFWSDVFNYDREWTLDLCEKIIETGLKINWVANMRADTEDDEVAEFMYDAGCRWVSIGIESGSQYILDKIGKKVLIDQIENTVQIFKDNEINVHSYFVVGLPWETEDTIEETVDFAIRLKSDRVTFCAATPLPGTRFYKFAKEHCLLSERDSFENAYSKPVINSLCLPKEKLIELRKKAIKRFYLRPGFIWQTLKRVRSFTEAKNYIKAGLNLIWQNK